jgi:lipid A 3-O-deacylase
VRAPVLALIVLLSSAVPARAEPASFVFSLGQWGLRAHEPNEVAVQLEYRAATRWWWVRPLGGVLLSTEGTQYAFAGVVLEVPLPWGVVLAPGFAPGIRYLNGARDLGSVVLFKSSVELTAPLVHGIRVGASFSHISNAKLGQPNPGIETLLGVVQIDLGP